MYIMFPPEAYEPYLSPLLSSGVAQEHLSLSPVLSADVDEGHTFIFNIIPAICLCGSRTFILMKALSLSPLLFAGVVKTHLS